MAQSKAAKSAADPQHCDVLMFVLGGGTVSCLWNVYPPLPPGAPAGGHLSVPEQEGPRLEPGLSFVPGSVWARVQETNSYKEGLKRGELKPAAGHGGDLDAEWARIGEHGIAGMLDQSFHVTTLDRLQSMETDAEAPRVEVSDLIEARLERLAVKVAKQKQKQRSHRQRRRPGQVMPGMPI